MEQWASGPLATAGANFLAICVDSQECARMFHKLFNFKNCVNGWISHPSLMPDYGQLGCSGFIVLDGKGKCASRKTVSLLENGPEAAFMDVETLLTKLLPVVPSMGPIPSGHGYQVGSVLLLDGLKGEPTLNGRKVVVEGFITASGRFSVKLVGGERMLSVLPCSLAPLPSEEDFAVRKPGLTGCTVIDSEHAVCTDALNTLLTTPTSLHALEKAMAVLSSHFCHEEEILRAHKFGESSGSTAFSALDSHAKDHLRILAIGKTELSRVSDCVSTVGAEISVALAQAFVEHARNFDACFEDKIPADAV